jgi:chemotaxis regulatin CheY-phosphate phosphatase CheZ
MSEESLAHKSQPPSALPDADYDRIYATLTETAQGRGFLEEHARRIRPTSLEASLIAIERIQAAIRADSGGERTDVLLEMAEMAQAIVQLRAELGSSQLPGAAPLGATEELDSIVHATENATSKILAAAEQVQEIAWTLRESGANNALCDLLHTQATDIYTACGFQDLTGQRTRKVIQVLHWLEQRINATVAGRAEKSQSASLQQADVDAMLEERQDATLEDISAVMRAIEPAIAPEPEGKMAVPVESMKDVRPELAVAEAILKETETAREMIHWAVEPDAPAQIPAAEHAVEVALPDMTDWVVEDPSAPRPDSEPAWMILHRLEIEDEAEDDVPPQPSTPPPKPRRMAEPELGYRRRAEPEESALFVAEAMTQLAQTLRPSSLLPPPELNFPAPRKPADPLIELRATMAANAMALLPSDDDAAPVAKGFGEESAIARAIAAPASSELMLRAAAIVAETRMPAPSEGTAGAVRDSDPDDFLFEPEEAKPVAAQLGERLQETGGAQASASPPPAPQWQSGTFPDPALVTPQSLPVAEEASAPLQQPKSAYDPLAPLRTLSDAQKIALFS